MNIEEIATKADIEALEHRIASMIANAIRPERKNTFSLADACEYLGGMAPATLRHKASTYEIASHKNGKHLVFNRLDLDRYLESTRRKSNEEIQALI